MKNNFKRSLAMLLAIMMVVGACAFPISAADDTNATQTPETTACEKCGETAKLVRKHEGDCTTQAFKLYRCEACGYDFMTDVGAFGDHEWVTVDPVKDTCVDGVIGHNGGEQCSVCKTWKPGHEEEDEQCDPAVCVKGADGVVVHDVTADSCMHTWDNGTITNGLTCTDGDIVTEYNCTVCTLKQVITQNNSGVHAYEFDWANADLPDCTEPGQVRRVCTRCECPQECAGEEVIVTIAALGHVYDYTANETGHTVTCERGCTLNENEAHTPDTNAAGYVPGNCGTAGAATCTLCEADYVIAATGNHSYDGGTVTTPSTCTVAGVITKTCSVCSGTTTEPAPLALHTWGADFVVQEYKHEFDFTTQEANLKDGIYNHTCSVCGITEENEASRQVAAHDENEVKRQQEATCQRIGYDIVICTCGYSTLVTNPIVPCSPKLEANGTPKVDSTVYNCVTGGYEIWICKWCTMPIIGDDLPAGQHVPGAPVVTPAGHNQPKVTVVTCTLCPEVLSRESTIEDPNYSECVFTKLTESTQEEFIANKKFVYGDKCVTGYYYWTWCDNSTCQYYFDESTLSGNDYTAADQVKLDAWLNDLDDDVKDDVRANCYLRVRATGHVDVNGNVIDFKNPVNPTVIVPATCTTDGLMGVRCVNEGCPLPVDQRVVITGSIDHLAHADKHGDTVVHTLPDGTAIYNWMDLDEVVWSCGGTDYLQVTSTYRCVKCTTKIVYRTTYAPSAGITYKLSKTVEDFSIPGSVVTEADTERFTTEVRVFKLYVNGVLKIEKNAETDEGWTYTIEAGDDVIYAGGEHAYITDKLPTCGKDGEEHCRVCKAVGVIDKTNGHDYQEITAPTCMAAGTEECTVCHAQRSVAIDPTAHNFGTLTYDCKDEEKQCINVDATTGVGCTATGTLTHTAEHTPGNKTVDYCTGAWTAVCTVCSDPLSGTDTTLINHPFQDTVLADNSNLITTATCNAKATYRKVCPDCGAQSDDTNYFESGDFAACNYIVETVADDRLAVSAKCNAYAVYYKSCEWCGASSEGTTDAPTFEYVAGGYADHNPSNVTTFNPDPLTTPLCTQYTFTSVDVCTVCDAVLVIYDLDGMYGHEKCEASDANWTPATCLRPGYHTFTCIYCGLYDATMGWDKEVEEGEKAFHVNASGYDLTGHCVYLPLVKDANGNIVYESDGVTPKTDYVCATPGCGATINPDKHVWGTPVTDKHITTTTCTVVGCGETETTTTSCNKDREVINIEPTATTSGEKEFFCTVCGVSQGTKPIDPLKTVTVSLDYKGMYKDSEGNYPVVNGGKVYVTVSIALDTSVTTTFVACNITLNVNPDHLKLVGIVDGSSINGFTPSFSQVNNTVTLTSIIGVNAETITLPGNEAVFCVLEFDVVYTGGVANSDRACETAVKSSEISFGEVVIINENDAPMGIKEKKGITIEIDQVGDIATEAESAGKIDIFDAVALLREIEKTYEVEGYYNAVADINRDSRLDDEDLLLMRAYISDISKTYEEFAGFDNE